jgi:hypothetical protein
MSILCSEIYNGVEVKSCGSGLYMVVVVVAAAAVKVTELL